MPPAYFDPREPADSTALSPLDETLAQWPQVDHLPDDAGALKAMMRQLIDVARKQSDAACKQIDSARMQALSAQSTLHETRTELIRTQEDLQATRRRLELFLEQIALARKRQFGASSERLADQHRLFDEAEVLADAPDAPVDQSGDDDAGSTDSRTRGKPKGRGKRAPLPPELPRIDIVHDLPQDQRLCACGTPMVLIGQEISEQLDIVPMRIQVLRHIRNRYGCPAKDTAPLLAPLPAQPLPKSNASPGLLATLFTVKYADGLPLARFEKVLARHGVKIPRQTLARYVINSAPLLQPILNLVRDELFEGPYVHLDETRIQVLKQNGRKATSDSYMWVQRGGPPGRTAIVFDYDPSRSSTVPLRLLEGYQGFIVTDGYAGYNALARTPGIEQQGCWAHCRRGFVDAIKAAPQGKHGRAEQAIEFIKQLYRIERDLAGQTDTERFLARRLRSVPILKQLRRWLDETITAVTPKSTLGKALAYMHSMWPILIRYVEWGYLPIDNNPAENAIRPFVVGRKAWMCVSRRRSHDEVAMAA